MFCEFSDEQNREAVARQNFRKKILVEAEPRATHKNDTKVCIKSKTIPPQNRRDFKSPYSLMDKISGFEPEDGSSILSGGTHKKHHIIWCFLTERIELGNGKTDRFFFLRKGFGKPGGFPKRSEATSEIPVRFSLGAHIKNTI